MTFFHALFQLLIGPLEIIYQVVFYCARLVTSSTGLSIIGLSLIVNLLLLPLYRQADAIQDEERAKQKQLAAWVKHIKTTFSGNERFMMLQTYYRQNNYRPYYALRGMLPLLLEVPFFIAAYHFLSNLGELRQIPFGPIRDLAAPDGILRLGGMRINVLPILMTVINLVSGAIYTKGLPLKDKLQLYGMALVFLVLLYDSPAGLVVYWTMNNLFSLVKNLLVKLPRPRRVVDVGASVCGVLLALGVLIWHKQPLQNHAPQFTTAALLQLPLLFSLLKLWIPKLSAALRRRFPRLRLKKTEQEPSYRLFLSGCGVLTLLTGALIPSAVIAASPQEFVYFANYRFPLVHVLSALLLAAGMFLIWFSLFYLLSGKKARRVLDCAIWVVTGFAIVNYMFFGTKLGNLSRELKFDHSPRFPLQEHLLNAGVLIALAAGLTLIWRKKRKLAQFAYAVLAIALIGMSLLNVDKINKARPELEKAVENTRMSGSRKDDGPGVEIRLSKEGQNVIVIMLDRAIGSYVPYLFEELPQLREQYAGFTYYPNTLSFGLSTNFAAPALFGGYEYTPDELNRRSDESLKDKHDEALLVMPTLFSQNGYGITVLEPPYAGYSWVPDLSVFREIPDVVTHNTEQGQFNPRDPKDLAAEYDRIWERNFFCYSIMKISPCALQNVIYEDGRYYASDAGVQHADGLHVASGMDQLFMNYYSVLDALPSISAADETGGNTFLMMSNNTTHEARLLQAPEYRPQQVVDNTEYDAAHADRFTVNGRTMHMDTLEQMGHYHANACALLRLGEWFEWMRENGVYDNTRIIIAADHGRQLRQFDDLLLGKKSYEDIMAFNPLLLVKDFGSTEFTTDDRFMTNADVPTMALDGLVEDPHNPFTGKPINSDAKAGEQRVIMSLDWSTDKNNGNTFLPGEWYAVQGSALDPDSWSYIDTH